MTDLQVEYRVVEDYNGACCPLGKGLNTFFRTPCTEEPRIKLIKGDTIFATRGTKWAIIYSYFNGAYFPVGTVEIYMLRDSSPKKWHFCH